jgi:hypothetical protein
MDDREQQTLGERVAVLTERTAALGERMGSLQTQIEAGISGLREDLRTHVQESADFREKVVGLATDIKWLRTRGENGDNGNGNHITRGKKAKAVGMGAGSLSLGAAAFYLIERLL